MNILIPFPYVREGGGGIANFIRNFSKQAAALGHAVTIVTSLHPGEKPEERLDGVTYRRLAFAHKRFFRRIRDYPAFSKLVQAELKKGTLPHDVMLGVSYAALAGVGKNLVYRSAGGPVHWEMTMWQRLWREGYASTNFLKRLAIRTDFKLQERMERTAVKAAKALLCQSKDIAKGFKETYGTSVPVNIPCTGVDTKEFAPRKSALKDELGIKGPLILLTGGCSIVKGAPILERAIPFILTLHPDVTIAIAGSQLYDLQLAPEHQERVRLLGHIDHKHLPTYYNAADIFLFPSVFNEGFPNAVLEAMASGCAIVTTRLPGIEEYLAEDVSAEIVETYDPHGLAQGVIRLLESPKLRATLGKNARKASLTFDWKTVAPDICAFIERVCLPSKQ